MCTINMGEKSPTSFFYNFYHYMRMIIIYQLGGNQLSDNTEVQPASSNTVKKQNILEFLLGEYGGMPTVVKLSVAGLNSFVTFKNNRIAQTLMRVVTGSLIGYDLYTKFNKFGDVNKDYSERNERAAKSILKIPMNGYINNVVGSEFNFTTTLAEWVASNPKELNIISFYDGNGNVIKKLEQENLIHVKFPDNDRSLVIMMKCTNFSTSTIYHMESIYSNEYSDIVDFANLLIVKYYDSIGWGDNIITFDNCRMVTRKRSEGVDFEVQRDVYERLERGIHYTMENNTRRGFLIVGKPGTGKTSIILQIEKNFTQYPIIHIKAHNLKDDDAVYRITSAMRVFKNSILYFEDMDTLEIEDKTVKLAPILELLDNSRQDGIGMVIIATINDANKLNRAVVRTGRFDEILEVKPPRTWKECNDILFQELWWSKRLSFINYIRLRLLGVTQSDLAEIRNRIKLDCMDKNNKSIKQAIQYIKESRKTFKKFHND